MRSAGRSTDHASNGRHPRNSCTGRNGDDDIRPPPEAVTTAGETGSLPDQEVPLDHQGSPPGTAARARSPPAPCATRTAPDLPPPRADGGGGLSVMMPARATEVTHGPPRSRAPGIHGRPRPKRLRRREKPLHARRAGEVALSRRHARRPVP